MSSESRYVDQVREVLREALHLGDRAAGLNAESGLFGALPEFDSMAVVSVMTLLEEEYGLQIRDEEVTADIFATVGTLAEFLRRKVEH